LVAAHRPGEYVPVFPKEVCVMVRTTLRVTSALALLLAVSALAESQEVAPKGRPGTVARYPRSILGSRVMVRGGTAVGTVEDVVVSEEGVVDYLIVSEGGRMVTVPWEAAKIDYEKRVVNVPISQEQFRAIPTYTTERYPNYYTPEYRTQTYKFYGLTPGEARRLERRSERRP